MKDKLIELCRRYQDKQPPKDLVTIIKDNPDIPVVKVNIFTVNKFSKKLVKFLADNNAKEAIEALLVHNEPAQEDNTINTDVKESREITIGENKEFSKEKVEEAKPEGP